MTGIRLILSGLAIRDHGLAGICVYFEFTEHTVLDNLKVQLALLMMVCPVSSASVTLNVGSSSIMIASVSFKASRSPWDLGSIAIEITGSGNSVAQG